MLNVLLIRGLPGSGKSWLASCISMGKVQTTCLEADNYFYDESLGYQFDPAKLTEAHLWCFQRFLRFLTLLSNPLRVGEKFDNDMIIVSNTFSCRWEMEKYLEAAKKRDIQVKVIDLFDNGMTDEELVKRNIHDVPIETIQAMRSRWEHDWKNGNPLPPWEREENQKQHFLSEL